MRKFKFLTIILSLMVFLGSFAACNFSTGSTHVCESVCEVCGGCMDEECAKKACKEKCECEAEEPAPEHTCESECEECGGCMNADCEEEACEIKCDCEEAEEHTCESVCEECGGCKNADCEEEACENKCDCEAEEPAPEHTCESVCEECGGCKNADCEEEACETKCECEAEEPAPEHTCESVCEECGGCTNADCNEEACENKCECEAEEPAPEHTCESVCETCGGCTNADCNEEACATKCECEAEDPVDPVDPAPEHTCESVCPTCNKCTNADCNEAACVDKCLGHHVCESVCATCGKCTDLACTEAVCADKCQGHHTCQSKCELCGKCKDGECKEEVCEEKCEGHTVNDDWDAIELNFMSFNINYSNSNPTQDVEVTDWTQRKEHVLSFVNTSGAHVIGLQEIAEWKSDLQNQRLYFEQNLASKYELVYFDGYVNLATVYDKEVFNLLSTEQYWYSDTPDKVSYGWDGTNYRSATILMLEHRLTGEIVRAINTHGPLSDTGNVKAFEYLAERSLSDENDTFTFLCGDFNATPNKLGYVPVAEKLQDCRLAAEESPSRGQNTYNGYGKITDNETGKNIIDYCFVSKFDNVKVLNYQVRTDRWGEGNYLADHYAVQTTVRIYNDSDNAWTGFH